MTGVTLPRSMIWKSIADTLMAEIAAALYGPGAKLPTEAALAARFGVNRHTVRHALAALAAQSIVYSRRGAGVFVAAAPTDYALGRRVRFHQNIAAIGRTPSRQISRIETRPATEKEIVALRLPRGSAVHVIEGTSFADGQPLAFFRSAFPAARFSLLPDHMRATQSITDALRASGLDDYTRASTRITAKLANPLIALALQVAERAPILRSLAVNVDAAGDPVEYGATWFAGDRVTITITPQAQFGAID